jgi:hypothetical protein
VPENCKKEQKGAESCQLIRPFLATIQVATSRKFACRVTLGMRFVNKWVLWIFAKDLMDRDSSQDRATVGCVILRQLLVLCDQIHFDQFNCSQNHRGVNLW